MTGIDGTVELLRDQIRQATARAEEAEAALARAQELQRGAEAQHCAALARVGELEEHLAQWQGMTPFDQVELRKLLRQHMSAKQARDADE